MQNYSISELNQALKTKKISSVELTQYFLERIKRFNSNLNAFITVTEALALEQAKKADQQLAKDSINQPDLLGVPIAHKDLFCTKGIKTSAASKMLDNFIAPYDATIVRKLGESGAVVLGKLNMDEFAMGSTNETSFYGSCFNPWNLEHVPGGSSGGSAAAVSAGLTVAATASDTGGSIRQPASFCGLSGIKPTYGRVSRYGMIAFASSLDQAGVIAKSAEDCAYLLQTMSGQDDLDSTSQHIAVPDYVGLLKGLNPNTWLKGKKIGIPKEFFAKEVNSEVAEKVLNALKELEKQGAILVDISLPNTHLVVPTYYTIAPAEASSNLSRFDGVRFGYRCDQPKNLEDLYTRSRTEGFGEEVKRRIMIGVYSLSAGCYESHYLKAQQIRRKVHDDYQNVLKQVDIIAGPTSPYTATKLGANNDSPELAYLNDIFTIGANLAGLPAMSIPCGFDQANMPIGLQLIGRSLDEASILSLAHCYQQYTDFHKKIPNQFA